MISPENYTQTMHTELFNRLGVFFAFSSKQLEESSVEGVKYESLGGGMIAPVGVAGELAKELAAISAESIRLNLETYGKTGIIRRELFNYETFYTGDIADCADAVARFGITKEEVQKVYDHIRTTEDIDL